MADYTELVKALRNNADHYMTVEGEAGLVHLLTDAADAIEELLKAAKKMHTWIFLNTGDEQKAYDECGLSDEMNAALGYGGQFKVSVLKESEANG